MDRPVPGFSDLRKRQSSSFLIFYCLVLPDGICIPDETPHS